MHIKKFALYFVLWNATLFSQYTIMLDPYGDAQHTGRIIDNTFERGLTLQCAEYLKKELNQQFPQIRVILSRIPGEIVEPLQNASFANKLQVDLYLSICFYQTNTIPCPVHFYYYKVSPTDDMHIAQSLHWYNVHTVYLAHLSQTKKIAATFFNTLHHSEFAQVCCAHQPQGIPIIQLKGINAPALLVEMGLCNKDEWKHIIPACIKSIEQVIHEQ